MGRGVFFYGLSVPIMVFHAGGVWLDPTGAKWITEHPFGWNYHSREVYLAALVVVIPRLFFLTVILTVGLVAKNIKLMGIGILVAVSSTLFARTELEKEFVFWVADFIPTVN